MRVCMWVLEGVCMLTQVRAYVYQIMCVGVLLNENVSRHARAQISVCCHINIYHL